MHRDWVKVGEVKIVRSLMSCAHCPEKRMTLVVKQATPWVAFILTWLNVTWSEYI